MTTSVSSIFSTENIFDESKIKEEIDLNEIVLSSSFKSTPILTSVFNNCYIKALLHLHKQIDEIDSESLSSPSPSLSSFNVSEDDFDATVFSARILTPSILTIGQWRHEQSSNEKFHRLIYSLVGENMHSIVLNWIEIELKNEEERGSKDEQMKNNLKDILYEIKSMKKSIDIQRLYDLCGTTKDILIEHVDWKSIGTKMRSKGGFKYFDEYSLKRFWIHRCQYGLENIWSNEEDQLLDQLVDEYGYGKWMDIAQHELFQKKKKSAFMCAQRYMIKKNTLHSKRRFTTDEKENLLSMYKYRCSIKKDYRFCVSHAAYVLGDRCIPEITHVWAYLNPDIRKHAFTPDEDAILVQQTNGNPSICWTIIASTYLPDRSAAQCRQRYAQLMKSQATNQNKRTNKKANANRSKKYLQWFSKQPMSTQTFLEQFYPKNRMTKLQQSIIAANSKNIELLMEKISNNTNRIKKSLPLRELTLKLNQSTVTIDEIYAKFVNST